MVDLQDYNPGMHGTMTVVGSKKFRLPATDFIISPLAADADLCINSIVNGVTNPKTVVSITAGKYAKVSGSIPWVEYYVNTSETFYIKW